MLYYIQVLVFDVELCIPNIDIDLNNYYSIKIFQIYMCLIYINIQIIKSNSI